MNKIAHFAGAVVVVALMLSGPISPTAAQNLIEPKSIACGQGSQPPDFFSDVRKAASIAANLRLLKELEHEFPQLFGNTQTVTGPMPSLQQLPLDKLNSLDRQLSERILEAEQIAQGANRQCREIAEPASFNNYMLNEVLLKNLRVDPSSPLSQIYLAQSIIRTLIRLREGSDDSDEQFNEILSQELLGRAQGFIGNILSGPSYEITLSRTALSFYPVFLLAINHGGGSQAADVLNTDRWASIACGGSAKLTSGITLDGSVFVQTNDSAGYPVRQTAAEFWSYSSILRNILLLLFDPHFGQKYLETAVQGCSAELRLAAADLYIALNPSLDASVLVEMAKTGGSPELQMAAATRLVSLWSQNLSLSDAELQERALHGETLALRLAGAYALGLRWLKLVETGQLDSATRFAFPPDAHVQILEGTLPQFAAAHADIHPELAQAVILPLFKIYFEMSN